MSIEPLNRRHVLVHGPGVLLVTACFVVKVRAAAVDFRPAMNFGVFHNGNISVIGAGQGDEVTTLAFDLVWDRQTPTSAFALTYSPSVVVYRQSDGLDYFANTLVVDFTRHLSEASQVKVAAYFARTDYQGQTADTADRATTFVPRSTQTLATVSADGTVPAGRRGFVDWQLRVGVDLYEDVPDDPATTAPDQIDFNNDTFVAGAIAWRRKLSVRNTLGLGFRAAHFGYESTPTVVGGTFGMVGDSQLGRSWKLAYAVGASRASSDGDSTDGFSFDIRIGYQAGEASTFSVGARQGYSPGRGFGGATQDLGAWISYGRSSIARGITGSVVAGYWQRNALQLASTSTSGDTETFNVRGSIGWAFNRYVALDGAYMYVYQLGTNGAASALDTNYSSYGLYLRWAIRGR